MPYFEKLRKYFYPILLVFTVIVLFLTNIRSGTYFIGWDNLQAELDYWLSFKRNFFAAWQEYQGLGLPAGHAHAVESIRLVVYFPFYVLLSSNLFRYFFHFSTVLIGVLSFYVLSKEIFLSKVESRSLYAFLGALFYLLNIGTVQNFYAPLETFSAFYAFFPLTILFIIKYLYKASVKNLLLLSISFLLLSISFHIPTLFVVYSICVFLPLTFYSLYSLLINKYKNFKSSLIIFFSFAATNLYWLLNFIYFYITNVNVRFESLSNKISSQDVFLQNAAFGDLLNVLQLKGFWFGNTDYFVEKGAFGYMFKDWQLWVDNYFIQGVSFIFVLVLLLGIIYCFKNTTKLGLVVLYFFFISLFFLVNINFPTGFLFKFFRNISPTFAEIFRFPFTKWIIPASFSYSILFTFGVYYISSKLNINLLSRYPPILKGIIRRINLEGFIITLFTVLIIIYSFPSFTGNFFYKNLKLEIPQEYFDTFEYFKEQPKSTRIANLPQPTFWGWGYTDWGLRGSGFIWYGIEQPITDRAFDVWNYKNEQLYNEFQYAIYSKDAELLEYLIGKYQLNYLLLDKNVATPGAPRSTFYKDTEELLLQVDGVELDRRFGEILVYKSQIHDIQSYVYIPKSFVPTTTDYEFSNVDPFYYNPSNPSVRESLYSRSNYIKIPEDYSLSTINYPYSDDKELSRLLQTTNELPVGPLENKVQEGIIFQDGSLFIPNLPHGEPIPARVSFNNQNIRAEYIYPKVKTNTGKILYDSEYSDLYETSVNNPNESSFLLNDIPVNLTDAKQDVLLGDNSELIAYNPNPMLQKNLSENIYGAEPFDCNQKNSGGAFGKLVGKDESVILISKDTAVCLPLDINFTSEEAVIFKVQFQYKSSAKGVPLYCITGVGGDSCYNKKYSNSPQSSTEFKQYIDYVYVPASADKLYLSLILENYYNQESTAEFKNIFVSAYSVQNEYSLAPSESAYNIEEVVELSENAYIELPSYSNLNRSYLPGSGLYKSEPQNCDNFNEVEFDRELSGSDERYYKYSALDAISCDSIKVTNFNPSASWLFTFKNDWIKGKGLDICIAGTNLDKCLIQDRLYSSQKSEATNSNFILNLGNSTSNLTKQNFILPTYPVVEEVRVNLSNQSIGRIETENHFYGFDVNYVPYKWLKGISVISQQSAIREESPFIFNSITLSNVKKRGTHYYEVSIKSNASSSPLSTNYSLINLNQSFDPGWGLYNKSTCLIGIKTSFTCKKISSIHITAKNWANSWLIEDIENLETGDSQTFLIIFWPQYLQYLGYLFLFFWFGFLLYNLYINKFKTKNIFNKS